MFINQISDVLTDDALLLIFNWLDEADLQRCQFVCRRWHRLIYPDVTKKFYENKIKSSERWRKCFEMLQGAKMLSLLRSSEICREIDTQVKHLASNWRTGNFHTKVYSCGREELPYGFRDVSIGMNDHFLLEYMDDPFSGVHHPFILKILNKQTMKVKHEIFTFLINVPPIIGKTLVIPNGSMIEVVDADTSQTVCHMFDPDGLYIYGVCFRSDGLLAAVSQSRDSIDRRLNIWRVNGPQDIAFLKQLPMDGSGRFNEIEMDEYFIVVILGGVRSESFARCDTVYVVSTATLEIVRSLSVVRCDLRYSKGLLIILNDRNLIRLVDVSSGKTRLADFKPMKWSWSRFKFRVNSRFLVVMNWLKDTNERSWTKFGIFDIETIKNSVCDVCNALVTVFEVHFAVYDFQVDETQMVCIGTFPGESLKKIMVIDFILRPPVTTNEKDQ